MVGRLTLAPPPAPAYVCNVSPELSCYLRIATEVCVSICVWLSHVASSVRAIYDTLYIRCFRPISYVGTEAEASQPLVQHQSFCALLLLPYTGLGSLQALLKSNRSLCAWGGAIYALLKLLI